MPIGRDVSERGLANGRTMPETSTNFSLVGPHAGMFDAWFALYERYAAERGAAPDRRVAGTLWRWLLDGTYRVAGIIAIDTRKEIVGFAHYRPYPNTLNGTEACWLDDLYVAPLHLDSDLTERLVAHVVSTARKRGWSEVTWVSATDPELCAIYDRVATRTELTTYRIALDERG
jgi:GNAT superfamily N-acetyltransferase